MISRSQRTAARVFAIATPLTFALVTVAYICFFAPFAVWEQDAETARNLGLHLHAVHMYLASAVAYGVGQIVILAALFVVLRPIGRGLAVFAASARLIYAVMWFFWILDLFGAVRIMSDGSYSQKIGPDRLPALAGLQMASGWDAYYIGLTCYAIAWIAFSILLLMSRYVPRALALYGVAASLFETVCAFAYLNDRNFEAIVSPAWYELPVILFELVVSVWILVRGIRPPEAVKALEAS